MSAPNKPSTVSVIVKLTTLLLQNCKWYLLFSVLVCAAAGFGISYTTIVKQWFFESIEPAVVSKSASPAVMWGVYLGVLLIVSLAFQGISDILMDNLGIKLSGFLGQKVNRKAARIDPVCYENPEMLNDISKAYQGVQNASNVIKIAVTNVAFFVPYFLFFIVYLYKIEPVLCIIFFLVFLPALGGHFFRVNMFKRLEDYAAPIRRKKEYFEKCIVDKEYAKESRLLGAVWFFRNLYEINLLLYQTAYWKTRRNSLTVELCLRLIGLLVLVVIFVMLFIYLQKGVITTAIFIAVVTSIDQMFNYIDTINYGFREISTNLPAVHNAMRFLELPERVGSAAKFKDYSIRFNNVSFRYPQSEKFSLKNINLEIASGETVAIVGENGAGKSTLVKMILGIYLPLEGDVYLGGYTTRTLAQDSLNDNVSAVFQKFQRYKMTLNDNITISNIESDDPDKVNRSLEKADIQIDSKSFTHGANTMLSREFDGVDLSGGQWQRIAIGRGFYRTHGMIVLDEPTAAIDPIEETRIYKQFAEMSKGKTAVIVTHRLGSARVADKIIVMDSGEIVDTGTHDQLLEKGGIYSAMYHAQAQWYV